MEQKKADGRHRVIIEHVQPQVNEGQFPAKRTLGERVDVTASIFADGHDHLRAEVLFKNNKESEWRRVPMKDQGNDHWLGSFFVEKRTVYFFTVEAWVDHLDTWYDGLLKKIKAGLDVALELKEGALLFAKVNTADNSVTKGIAEKLTDKKSDQQNIQYVQNLDFAQIVHRLPLRSFETRFNKELSIVVESKKALFSTWYELFPRSAAMDGSHGTFKDVVRLLPRIASMGFDVLYLPPIHPIGRIHRKGKNNSTKSLEGEPGSPWAIGSKEGGHKSVHPDLGTLADYKILIAEARKHQIEIAFDLAFQCAPDHPYVAEHPQWFKQRPDGTIQYAENPPKKYQDIYPFNFECDDWQTLWNELKSVIIFWIEQGVSIFRVDNPHTKPIPFWHWVIGEVHREYPDIIFLAEAFTRPKVMESLAKVGFTQSYTYFTWRVSKEELISYMNELVLGPARNYFRPNFWPNTPDILPYHLQHQGEHIFIIRLALAATLSSSYGIYGPPYEFLESDPIPGKEEYQNSEKYEVRHFNWKLKNRMTDIITLLNKARHAHPALQSTWNVRFCTVENPNLIAYFKYADDMSDMVLVIVNLDQHASQRGYVQLPLALMRLADKINVKLHDLVTDERYTWLQEWNYIELDPYKMPFHLFNIEVHESNM